MNLTRDQRVLIVGGTRQVAFFDVEKLVSGTSDPLLGTITDQRFADVGVGMALTPDDKFLFVPQRGSNWLTVINVEKARKEGFNAKAIQGGIPTGAGAMALLSPNGKYLYLMNTSAPPGPQWPAVCGDDNPQNGDKVREGLLQVIDVERAKISDKGAVLASVLIGCGPSRIAISPDGNTLYVSGGPRLEGTRVREESLLAFDTRPVAAGSAPRLAGRIFLGKRVGDTAPGLALIDGGRKIAYPHAIDSKSAVIAFIDTAKLLAGSEALIGVIPAPAGVTNLSVSADGRWLFSPTLDDKTLEAIDLQRLPEILRPPSELEGPPQPPAPPGHVAKYDPRRDAGEDIQNAIAVAQKSGKRILLEVGGDWCSWCHVLDRLFEQNPALTELRDRDFITVKINFGPDNENKRVLSRYPEIQGYPHMFVLDSDGSFLKSQDSGEFEDKNAKAGDGGKKEDAYSAQKFTAFFEKWAPSRK